MKQATHKLTGAVLAIKVYEKFKLTQADRRKIVTNEITALKKLKGQANIVKLYDVIETSKQVYLVMEYIKGRTLSQQLELQDAQEQTKIIDSWPTPNI